MPKKIVGIALIAVGAVLLYLGYGEYSSVTGKIGRAVGGSMSKETIAYFAGGGASALLGAFLIIK